MWKIRFEYFWPIMKNLLSKHEKVNWTVFTKANYSFSNHWDFCYQYWKKYYICHQIKIVLHLNKTYLFNLGLISSDHHSKHHIQHCRMYFNLNYSILNEKNIYISMDVTFFFIFLDLNNEFDFFIHLKFTKKYFFQYIHLLFFFILTRMIIRKVNIKMTYGAERK